MKILIFDTECTSLDTDNGFIQELAWAVFDIDTWRCLSAQSHILKWNTHYEVEPGALAVTLLTKEFCESNGWSAGMVLTELLADGDDVDFVCGHNAIAYDIPMLATNVKRACFYEYTDGEMSQKHVIDTLIDCPYPATMKQHSLKYLAYDHGYILSDAHQAMADVFACKHLLTRYDFNQVIAISKTPMITLTAKVDFNDLESRDRIKNARFYWSPKRKLWEKRIREFHLPGTQLTLGEGIELQKE